MTRTKSIEELNRELGEQVLEDAKRFPQKFAGRYVGIANEKVVVITDDLNEYVRRLKEVEPDPAKTYGVDLCYDYEKVYEIRGIR
jgi:hypothetical protein